MRSEVRWGSRIGNASAHYAPAPSSDTRRRDPDWPATRRHACAIHTLRGHHPRPVHARLSTPRSRRPSWGRAPGSRRPAPVQLGAVRFELRFVGHRADHRVTKRILGRAVQPHLVDEFRLDRAASTSGSTPTPSAVRCRNATRSPPRRSELLLAAGSRRSMRAAMAACRVAGTATSATSPSRVGAAVAHAAHRVLPGRGRSPRRKTGCRQPGRRRVAARPATDGSAPSNSASTPCFRIVQRRKGNRLRAGSLGQPTRVLGAVGDQHHRRGLRDHRQEVGQHRFADLVDPLRRLR